MACNRQVRSLKIPGDRVQYQRLLIKRLVGVCLHVSIWLLLSLAEVRQRLLLLLLRLSS